VGIFYSIDGVTYTNTTGVFSGLASGPYNVTVMNADGCVSLATPLVVNDQPLTPPAPTATVTQQPTCEIPTGTITVTSPAPGVGIFYSIDGVTYTNTTGVFSGLASGPYNVTVMNADGCVSMATPLVVLGTEEVPAQPGEFLESTTYICAGSTVDFSVPEDQSVIFIWRYSGSGATISGSGNAVSVSFAPDATSGTLSVVAMNGCGESEPRDLALTVRQLPGPAGIISGPSNICQGMEGVVYTVPVIPNATHYIWTIPSGAYIVSGDDTNTITVNFSETAVSGSITVQGSKLCGTGPVSPELIVTVRPLPGPAETITGLTEVCAGTQGVEYSVPVIQNATGYLWSIPSGATIVSGTNTNSITVDYSATASSGIITVQGVKSCGVGAISPALKVNVHKMPVQPANFIEYSGAVCQESSVIYSVPDDPTVTYSWSYTGTGVMMTTNSASKGNHATTELTDGAKCNTNSIIVRFSDSATSGILSVVAVNDCGISASREIKVTVRSVPGAAGTISGTSDVTQGMAGVVYSVPAIPNATSYVWTLPSGATIVSGANSNVITIDFSSTATSGKITVKGMNSCGYGPVSPNLNISVNSIPPAPVITQTGNTFFSDSETGNQWYLNGDPIIGATGQSYTATEDGNYTVVVTINGFTSAPSNKIQYVTTDVKDILDESGVEIYPNPSRGLFNVSIDLNGACKLDIYVYNSIGTRVFEMRNLNLSGKTELPFDLVSSPAGVYYIKIISGKVQVNKTIVLSR
jgi:hypothetical protein